MTAKKPIEEQKKRMSIRIYLKDQQFISAKFLSVQRFLDKTIKKEKEMAMQSTTLKAPAYEVMCDYLDNFVDYDDVAISAEIDFIIEDDLIGCTQFNKSESAVMVEKITVLGELTLSEKEHAEKYFMTYINNFPEILIDLKKDSDV